MVESLNIPNLESSERVWNYHGAENNFEPQYVLVNTTRDDWFLREWMSHFDKRQVALVNELGWNKQKASYLWNGKQPFNRDIINEVAGWLGIEAYELLMPPEEAIQLRHLRQAALAIAAQQSPLKPKKDKVPT